jgi:hypothetical protein
MHALPWNMPIHHTCTHTHTLGQVWAKLSCPNCIPMCSVELSMERANRAFNWPPPINHYNLIIRYPITLRKKLNVSSILTRVRDGAFVVKQLQNVWIMWPKHPHLRHPWTRAITYESFVDLHNWVELPRWKPIPYALLLPPHTF